MISEHKIDLSSIKSVSVICKRKEVDLTKPSSNGEKVSTRIALEKTFGLDFGCDYEDEEGMIGRLLEDPLMTLSISDILGDSVVEPNDIWLEYERKEINSFLDELKFESAEKSNYKYNWDEDNRKVIQHEKAIISEMATIFDDKLVESTDNAFDSDFYLITDDTQLEDFQLEDFPIDDFESFDGPRRCSACC